MKKLFCILIVLLLFLQVGFVYATTGTAKWQDKYGTTKFYEIPINALKYPAFDPDFVFIKSLVEGAGGSYYYMYSNYESKYSEIFGIIDLTQARLDTKGKRTAYIAGGVFGAACFVDMGLQNTGDGWRVCYYAPFLESQGKASFWASNVVPNAAKVNFTIGFPPNTNQEIVRGYFEFRDSSGNMIGTPITVAVDATGKFAKDSLGVPMCRFYRFASLVPNAINAKLADDVSNDGTYMEGVKVYALQLYERVGKKYVEWSTSKDTVQHYFTVKPQNITVNISGGGSGSGTDNISIKHDDYIDIKECTP